MTSAVVVIDVQVALSSGERAAFDVAGVIERINAVCRRARVAGVPIIFVQHASEGGVLQSGSPGWELAPALERVAGDLHVHKTATDSFHRTDLDEMLRRLGVTELVVCGLQSEFCVDTTVRRSLALGYTVLLVEDGHSTMDNGILTAEQISRHHTWTLTNIGSFGPRARSMRASEVAFVA